MKFLVLTLTLVASLSAHGKIHWKFSKQGSEWTTDSPGYVHMISQRFGLSVKIPNRTTGADLVSLPKEKLAERGLSIKDMIDLIESYNDSPSTMTVYISLGDSYMDTITVGPIDFEHPQ